MVQRCNHFRIGNRIRMLVLLRTIRNTPRSQEEGSRAYLSNAIVEESDPSRHVAVNLHLSFVLKSSANVMDSNAFFTGFPFTSIVVNIPQRFQAVNAASPTRAGLLLLPLLLLSPFASGLSGYLGTNFKVPPVYLVIVGSFLQLLGVGLMCSLSSTSLVEQKQQYAYEVIMGLGFGLVLTSLLGLIPLVVSKKDMPVVIGAVTQFRVLGGTIGLAISTTVLNSFVKNKLPTMLSPAEIAGIGNSLSEIAKLTVEQQEFVRRTFAEGYARQIWVTAGFSGLVVVSSFLMWERKPRRHHIGEGTEDASV